MDRNNCSFQQNLCVQSYLLDMRKGMLSSHWMESQYSPSYREADKVSQFQVEGFQGI